ncbi:hypothetical protein ACSBR2_006164 [Camellia fascicularis]|nr:hypothetical protein LOK49_Contig504G00002 [Camellia lanceoleosa]
METEKRKRTDDGELDGKKTRVREDNGWLTVTEDDDDVEEFYAILQRIQVAVKYFQKGNGEYGRRELTANGSKSWSPSFEPADFKKVDGVKGPNGVEEDTGLDLNADPEGE